MEDSLRWDCKIPLITNTILIRDSAFVFGGAILLLSSVLFLLTWDYNMFYLFFIVGAAVFVLALVIMLVLQVALGGLDTTFYINTRGVGYNAGKSTKALDRLTLLGAASLGSMAGAGAGSMAVSEESNFLPWGDVRHITVHSRQRLITLRTKYLIFPVPLYCTPDNFNRVLGLVEKYAHACVKMR